MKDILFNNVGAGRSILESGMMLSATWPFARLIMTSESVEYRLLRKKITFRYEDIQEISISRLGFVWFRIMQEPNKFAFGWLHLDKVVSILQSHGVQIAPEELGRLGFAVGFVKFQVAFATVLFAIWLTGFLVGLGSIIGIGYRGNP